MNCNKNDMEFLKDCLIIDYASNIYFSGTEKIKYNINFADSFTVELLRLRKETNSLLKRLTRNEVQHMSIMNRKLQNIHEVINKLCKNNVSNKVIALFILKLRFQDNKINYGFYLNSKLHRYLNVTNFKFIYNLIYSKEFNNKNYHNEYSITVNLLKEFNRQRFTGDKLCVS